MTTDYPESFVGYPISLAERKSNDDRNGSKWTARDALIATLRRIDEEKLDVDALVVCYRTNAGEGRTVTYFASAAPDAHVALGLLAHVQGKIFSGG